MTWRTDELPRVVAALVARRGHEATRIALEDLLRHGFGAWNVGCAIRESKH